MSLHYEFITIHPAQAQVFPRAGFTAYYVNMQTSVIRAAFQHFAEDQFPYNKLAEMPGINLCIYLHDDTDIQEFAEAIFQDKNLMLGMLMASRGEIATGDNKCNHCREQTSYPFVQCFQVAEIKGCASCWAYLGDKKEHGCVEKE